MAKTPALFKQHTEGSLKKLQQAELELNECTENFLRKSHLATSDKLKPVLPSLTSQANDEDPLTIEFFP